jgi:di/tricarboxylate transporter
MTNGRAVSVSVAKEAVRAPSATRVAFKLVPTLAIPVALWLFPFHLTLKAQHAIAITVFMILAWATEVMDHGLTGLIGCYLFWALGVVRFEVAFSGFADDTPWFLMGAILFGTMASKSGLARRLAYLVTVRIGTSYVRLLLALILSDFLLTLLYRRERRNPYSDSPRSAELGACLRLSTCPLRGDALPRMMIVHWPPLAAPII